MLDIHAHVLPALDNGPQTFEESLRTLAALTREGIGDVVATPQFRQPYELPAAEVRARVGALQRVVVRLGVKLRLWAGHEAALDEEIAELLGRGVVATINDGCYALLTIPADAAPESLPPLIRGLRRDGVIPVLAHVERYVPAGHDAEVLVPLIEAGALMQVAAPSLLGVAGTVAQRLAEELLQRNMAHVLASGAHAVAERPPHFRAGVQLARALVGPERVRELVVHVPYAIIRGAPVEVPPMVALPRPRRGRSYE